MSHHCPFLCLLLPSILTCLQHISINCSAFSDVCMSGLGEERYSVSPRLFTQREMREKAEDLTGDKKIWQSSKSDLTPRGQMASAVWYSCVRLSTCASVCDYCNSSTGDDIYRQHSTFWALINTALHSAPSLSLLPASSSSTSSSLTLALHPPLLISLPRLPLCIVLLSFTTHPYMCPSALPHAHTSSLPPPPPRPSPSSAISPCLRLFSLPSHQLSPFLHRSLL